MFDIWYDQHRDTAQGWLEWLHRHPETGFGEVNTAEFVANLLRQLGYQTETGIGGTGVVGTLHGTSALPDAPGRIVAFRAELDALPMDEKAKIDYRSETPGRFHGCGHDGHMTTALTAAAYLTSNRDFEGTVRFIFQPAEELLNGARAMIADGLFDRFPCDEIYALHNMPGIAPGHVAIPAGAALSSADDINIAIHANGAHGSMPHTGEDAIAAAAHLISSVQQAATRVADAREAGVISFGKIVGGSARNILPETVVIEGTMRTTSDEVRDRLADLLKASARATEELFGAKITIDVKKAAPVTMNHALGVAAVTASATRVLGADHVIENARAIMASEDFSEFLRIVPGAYFFAGQNGFYPHHQEYVFDPAIIPVGAAIFADLARTRTSARMNSTN